MNDEAFFGKVIVNALRRWSCSFGDDILMRAILDRCDFMHGAWSNDLNEKKQAWLDNEASASGYKLTFAPLEKIISREDAAKIVERITEQMPEIANPFQPRQTTLTIAELLDLNEFETILLDSACRFQEGVDYDIHSTLARLPNIDRYADKAVMYSEIFDFPIETVRATMDGFLFHSGVLKEGRASKGFWSLNDDIAPAFITREMTPAKVEQMLFPAMLDTDLDTADYPHLEKEIERVTNTIQKGLREGVKGLNVMLWGEPGTGKTELAIAIAKKQGWNMKVIGDISVNDTGEKSRASRLASLKLATKLLARDPNAVLLFDEMEDLFKSDNNAAFSKAFINRIIETTPVPIIWTTNALHVLGNAVLRRMVYNIGFEVPPESTRITIWKKYAAKYGVTLDDDTFAMLGKTFDIAPALIRNAMLVTSTSLDDNEKQNVDAIMEVVASADRLVNYGERRTFTIPKGEKDSTYDPSCSNTDRDLTELTERLIKAKPGFSLLLYGAPGTGKSEYGRHVAHKLGKKVLFKRASDLLGMFLGETEKNLAAAFAEAKRDKKVLIIDEGDSFLQNRAKAVRSWEVQQVNEMLSQMEVHDQPFVLTTNLKDDLDPASMRRFTFKMKFNYMRGDQTMRLFERFFGVAAPEALASETMLAPGDFANVKKQIDILGITDAEEIAELLRGEVRDKPGAKRAIGF